MDKKSAQPNIVLPENNKQIRNILVVGNGNNERGDLFNDKICDMFHALGFDESIKNLPEKGREIDLILNHRTENKVAIVECKSEAAKISGADLNKFAGALEVEVAAYKDKYVIGYFVSRSGFTATAIEQENQRAEVRNMGSPEIILIGPDKITRELIRGRVLCDITKAITAVNTELILSKNADLLVSKYGWIWVLYYSEYPEQQATHFALVHADGNNLLKSVADDVIESLNNCYPDFKKLEFIRPKVASGENTDAARKAYFNYLNNELGEIQFEGMPTDKEAGAVKVKLEAIFVPLQFNAKKHSEDFDFSDDMLEIKDVLLKSRRAAILAKPGGGKSTLVRRIALAYAFPDMRMRVNDDLPDMELFPIYIRCRDLGDNALSSIQDVIASTAQRAEIRQHEDAFRKLVEVELQSGRILLLIDGLDEISNERYRISFVDRLRTFVATYPAVHMLITSREAGFRAVAGSIGTYCDEYSIANLNSSRIRSLSKKWHNAILGESEQATAEAEKVCDIILNDPRITALACNPLLMTTLLFVKRWVGYLPTKKCSLYEEMIKLLLVTWNAVAHDRLDKEETEPQLAFTAYKMTLKGEQKIVYSELNNSIIKAREAIPEILGYTTISPSVFITQVEERSSLLIQTGFEKKDTGVYERVYEFSHLSFQEYLTAKAISQKWLPEEDNKELTQILLPHLTEEHWKEVIPMAAALSGRDATPFIKKLMELSSQAQKGGDTESKMASYHLANCIASEVAMSKDVLEEAILQVIKDRRFIREHIQFGERRMSVDVYNIIAKSKYGSNYRSVIENHLFNGFDDTYIYEFSDCLINLYLSEKPNDMRLKCLKEKIVSDKREDSITGALLFMEYVFDKGPKLANISESEKPIYETIFKKLRDMLMNKDRLAVYAVSWCFAWSGYNIYNIMPFSVADEVSDRLVELWLEGDLGANLKRTVTWALCSICRTDLKFVNYENTEKFKNTVLSEFDHISNDFSERLALEYGLFFNLISKEKAIEIYETLDRKRRIRSLDKPPRYLVDCGIVSQKKRAAK